MSLSIKNCVKEMEENHLDEMTRIVVVAYVQCSTKIISYYTG